MGYTQQLSITDHELLSQVRLDTERSKEAFGQLLSGLADWQWFVTMTFRKRVGLWAAERLWSRFWTEEQRLFGRVDWFRATEFQHWRGVPHFHGLIVGIPPEFTTEQCRLLAKEMGNDIAGFTRVLEYDSALGAQYYLTKYVLKELGDIKFTRGLRHSRVDKAQGSVVY